MRRGVDAASQPTDDRQPRTGQAARQLLGLGQSIVGGMPGTDDGDREGVVGQQPVIGPGETHEYTSFCPLPTPWGTMEGEYQMRRDDGSTFEARIERFYLTAINS